MRFTEKGQWVARGGLIARIAELDTLEIEAQVPESSLAALREGAHVRMDLLYMRLGLRGRALMDMITSACMLFYLAVLLWGAISSLEYSIEIDQHLFSMWNPSVIPIKVFMAAAIVLMILQGISLIFKDYAAWRGADIR